MRLTKQQDAYGWAVWDHYHGKTAYEIIERSDGYFATSGGPSVYLSEYSKWATHEKEAIKRARGKVLDIGCNAGRHAIYLQDKGFDVLGVDASPLAIKTAKLRGLRNAKNLSVTELSARLGRFDTILMLGNNFGLFGNSTRARWLLRRFKSLSAPGSKIITESLDVYQTEEPDHLAYLAENRKRGRMSGQIRMRGRYKRFVTPWFDYLMVSQDEMEKLVAGTGWRVIRCFNARGPRPLYTAVIERAE